jgi:hypothetical protein
MLEDAEDLASFFDAEDGLASLAIYRSGGAGEGYTLPVLPYLPDRTSSVFDVQITSGTSGFTVQVKDVQSPKAGDTLEVDGKIYTVKGVPRRDGTRKIWQIETME